MFVSVAFYAKQGLCWLFIDLRVVPLTRASREPEAGGIGKFYLSLPLLVVTNNQTLSNVLIFKIDLSSAVFTLTSRQHL